jgi:hypothetical protein
MVSQEIWVLCSVNDYLRQIAQTGQIGQVHLESITAATAPACCWLLLLRLPLLLVGRGC